MTIGTCVRQDSNSATTRVTCIRFRIAFNVWSQASGALQELRRRNRSDAAQPEALQRLDKTTPSSHTGVIHGNALRNVISGTVAGPPCGASGPGNNLSAVTRWN